MVTLSLTGNGLPAKVKQLDNLDQAFNLLMSDDSYTSAVVTQDRGQFQLTRLTPVQYWRIAK